ncbi:hypothetical protein MICA_1865 [Micavibrio aeruginosavorus ARL-13]|uniref:Uncharacterized protein n=1 Tax=Micavibrio aeruginosavorus (strain ARL-13) TaxID=856793 RepID=G2KM82_MICAA|nr:hypothetical protein MICA_1865 [Micavibrio aeruginosavorus ARL-13]
MRKRLRLSHLLPRLRLDPSCEDAVRDKFQSPALMLPFG